MKKDLSILWFRNDLRLHDNEALTHIMLDAESFLPVYVIDPRKINGEIHSGIFKMNQTRILFLLESIQDLRTNLRKLGSDLIVRVGYPEEVLYEMAREYKVDGVYCNRERMTHEVSVQNMLEKQLWSLGQELYYFRGKMLYYTADLPFPVSRTPVHFSSFLKETENFVAVRQPYPGNHDTFTFPDIEVDPGPIPAMNDLGYTGTYNNPDFSGGEAAGQLALERMMDKLSRGDGDHLRVSPWLSVGSLSPKEIYYKIVGSKRMDPSLRHSLKRKLILRDYYRLMGKKEPASLFDEGGFSHRPELESHWDSSALKEWLEGHTGHDYVDACMKCLSVTGFLSHKQRKVVAHFLLDEMKVHWLLGAGYFESVLLDYDPCSNYGNWQRAAGLSLDLRGRHSINFDQVGEQEDPDGSFRHQWSAIKVGECHLNLYSMGH